MDNRASGPLLDADHAEAFRRQLRGLAVALRTRAAPPAIEGAPDFLAADVTALCDAIRQDPR
jgi:hypothetical protein